MAERSYVNQLLGLGPITLEGEEAHHLAHVTRHAAGDEVALFNGDGCSYPARVVAVRKKSVDLEVLACLREVRELPHPITIACPWPKGDRGQFLVEKLTELGVSKLQLVATARTQSYRNEVRLDKLRRYVIEASKQCGRNVLMDVAAPVTWRELLIMGQSVAAQFVAGLGGKPLSECRIAGPAIFAFGPEGGLVEPEFEAARQAGWGVVSLGSRILRVETAALAAAAWAATCLEG